MSTQRLTEEELDVFEEHAKTASINRNPVPLLVDRVELLVAEVRRLREGIRTHRDSRTAFAASIPDYDWELWSLLVDREDGQ